MKSDEQPLWTQDYLRAFLVMLGISLVFITLMSFMALYAVGQFKVNETAGGFAASSFIAGGAVMRIVIGNYLDLIGRKRTLLVALSVFVLCSLLYPLLNHYLFLVLVRMLHGATFGAASSAIATTVVSLIPMQRLSEGLGYLSLASTVSNAVGPLTAVQLSTHTSPLWIFGFTTVCASVALLSVIRMSIPERPIARGDYHRWWRIRSFNFVDRKVLPVAIVGMFITIAYSLLMTYLPVYMIGLNMVDTASIFFIIWASSMLIVRLVAGRTHDHLGENFVVPPAIFSLLMGLILLAAATSRWHFLLAAALGGSGYGAVLPSLQSISITRTTADRVPLAISTHYVALDTGIAIGPVALGFMINYAGYPQLFLAGAFILFTALLMYWFSHGRSGAK